jgi:hypothetical protein
MPEARSASSAPRSTCGAARIRQDLPELLALGAVGVADHEQLVRRRVQDLLHERRLLVGRVHLAEHSLREEVHVGAHLLGIRRAAAVLVPGAAPAPRHGVGVGDDGRGEAEPQQGCGWKRQPEAAAGRPAAGFSCVRVHRFSPLVAGRHTATTKGRLRGPGFARFNAR